MTRVQDLFEDTRESVSRAGFAFVRSADMQRLLGVDAAAFPSFAASWNDLGEDRYMADGGRYRRRRHATFDVSREAAVRRPHQPHYQATDFNPLNGGIERWFDPVSDAIADHPVMQAVLGTSCMLFDALTPPAKRPDQWFVELHQFRIEASAAGAGQPTPEGDHRDGVDWVLVLLIARENIKSGMTRISDLDHQPLGAFTLADPLDAALVDDARVYHGVTPVEPLDPSKPAYRDVLVVTFKRA